MQTSIPMGGTELMRDRIVRLVPDTLRDKVQLVISQPPESFEDKPRILWLHDLPTQSGPVRALADDGHRFYDAIVFVSHWQREQFHSQYPDLPLQKTHVIQNGIEPLFDSLDMRDILKHEKFKKLNGPLKIAYTSTPHRGLELVPYIVDLLRVNEITNFEFHVYSSFVLYGQPELDTQYTNLFETLKNDPNVVYHGTVSNQEIRAALLDAHAFVYPSIYAETSCLAAIEALAAGCAVVVPSLAALPETCGMWAYMYDMSDDHNHTIRMSASIIAQLLKSWGEPGLMAKFGMQVQWYNLVYNIERRRVLWTSLFEQVIASDTDLT